MPFATRRRPVSLECTFLAQKTASHHLHGMDIIQRCILARQWQHTLYTYSRSFCSFPPVPSSPQDIEYCLGAMKPCYRNQFHGGCLAPDLGGKPASCIDRLIFSPVTASCYLGASSRTGSLCTAAAFESTLHCNEAIDAALMIGLHDQL